MQQRIDQNLPNMGALNTSQVAAVGSGGGFSAGGLEGNPTAKEFNDNRRVDMTINSNVDMDNMKRQLGRSLEAVNMGRASEL